VAIDEPEIVHTLSYDEYVREHRDRLQRLARWYRARHERSQGTRRKPRDPAEERLLERFAAWERDRKK
jgi:hypothetical protein